MAAKSSTGLNTKTHKRLTKEFQRHQKEFNPDNTLFFIPNLSEDGKPTGTGIGLIEGAEDTPYEMGFYLISFDFTKTGDHDYEESTHTYPDEPPRCKYITLSPVRQSPNLYEGGKVCLSILGTWGEKNWKPNKNIEKILVAIQSMVLIEQPIDCEPPYDRSKTQPKNSNAYNEIVRFVNFESNLHSMYELSSDLREQYHITDSMFLKIREIIRHKILSREDTYNKMWLEFIEKHEGSTHTCSVWPTTNKIQCNYRAAYTEFLECVDRMKDSSTHNDFSKAITQSKKPKKFPNPPISKTYASIASNTSSIVLGTETLNEPFVHVLPALAYNNSHASPPPPPSKPKPKPVVKKTIIKPSSALKTEPKPKQLLKLTIKPKPKS